jgi:S1-C subfamily serine protease
MTIRSGIAAALLAVFATNQAVLAQPAPTDAERWQACAHRLGAGARIEVRLRDGSTVRGTLVSVDETAMQVLPYTRVPVPVRAIAFRDVDVLERWRKGWSPGTKTLVVIGTGVGVGLAVAVAVLAASLD